MADLVVENVTKEFATRAEPLAVLKGASFTLSAGENLAILGPSGSGKSTLLNVLGCLDRQTSGTYRLDGTDVTTLDDAAVSRIRAHRIGFVFQSF